MTFSLRICIWKYRVKERIDRFYRWIAYHLPGDIVTWAVVRAMGYATSTETLAKYNIDSSLEIELDWSYLLVRWEDRDGKIMGASQIDH